MGGSGVPGGKPHREHADKGPDPGVEPGLLWDNSANHCTHWAAPTTYIISTNESVYSTTVVFGGNSELCYPIKFTDQTIEKLID